MPWKHVISPEKGMNTDKASTMLDPEHATNISGMFLQRGIAKSDFGMTDYPVPSITQSNELKGTVMALRQFYEYNGLSYLLCFTTSLLYQYNTSSDTWDVLSQGNVIDDCQAAWDAKTNVLSVADLSITGVIASVADYSGTEAGTVLVTDNTHGLSSGHTVVISGTNTYDGTYDVTVVDVNTFYITATWGATSTGAWTTSYIKIKGTTAAKHVIASAFTTGIISSEDDVTTADISNTTVNTHLTYWIRSSIAIAAEVLSVRLDEQAACAAGASYADYFVPALVAGVWQNVSVDITDPDADGTGDYPDVLNALASVGLIANSDPGACTIHIDDIRTTKNFTGDEDNRFSTTTMSDTFIYTNGINVPEKITATGGVLTAAPLTTTLAAGAITTAEIVLAFKDHLFCFNNTENAANTPSRASWTNIGKIEDWTGGTAGYQDLTNDSDYIMAVHILSENTAAIFKERSVVLMEWIGGQTPFRFIPMIDGAGAISKEGVALTNKGVLVVGPHFSYLYEGDYKYTTVDLPIRKELYGNLDRTYINRPFMFFTEPDNEVQIWTPTSTVYPDTGWCFSVDRGAWYSKKRSITGYGFYSEQSTITIGDLTGSIGEQNWTFGGTLTKSNTPIVLVGDENGKVYKLDKTSLNNDGTAITNTFDTPDFVKPQPDATKTTKFYESEFIRVPQLVFEASGQSVTTYWSSDGGLTWNPTQGGGTNTTTLNTNMKFYQQDFDATVRKIRFRFQNTSASSGFWLRAYGFYYIERSGRR